MKIGTKKVAMNSNHLHIYICMYIYRPHLFQCPIYTYRYVWCFLWTIHLITIRITSSLRKKNRNNDLPRAFMSMVNYIVLSKLIHFELPGKISCNIWRLFYDLQTYLDIIQYDLQNKIFESIDFIGLITSQNIMWHIF